MTQIQLYSHRCERPVIGLGGLVLRAEAHSAPFEFPVATDEPVERRGDDRNVETFGQVVEVIDVEIGAAIGRRTTNSLP